MKIIKYFLMMLFFVGVMSCNTNTKEEPIQTDSTKVKPETTKIVDTNAVVKPTDIKKEETK